MAVSVPISEWIIPPKKYYPDSLPYIPNIPVYDCLLPHYENLIAAVMNEAVENIHRNNARMYTYNLLSAYNWKNYHFIELIMETLDYQFNRMLTGMIRHPYQQLNIAAEDMVKYYVARQATIVDALRSSLSAQELNTGVDNVKKYVSLKTRLSAIRKQVECNEITAGKMVIPYPDQPVIGRGGTIFDPDLEFTHELPKRFTDAGRPLVKNAGSQLRGDLVIDQQYRYPFEQVDNRGFPLPTEKPMFYRQVVHEGSQIPPEAIPSGAALTHPKAEDRPSTDIVLDENEPVRAEKQMMVNVLYANTEDEALEMLGHGKQEDQLETLVKCNGGFYYDRNYNKTDVRGWTIEQIRELDRQTKEREAQETKNVMRDLNAHMRQLHTLHLRPGAADADIPNIVPEPDGPVPDLPIKLRVVEDQKKADFDLNMEDGEEFLRKIQTELDNRKASGNTEVDPERPYRHMFKDVEVSSTLNLDPEATIRPSGVVKQKAKPVYKAKINVETPIKNQEPVIVNQPQQINTPIEEDDDLLKYLLPGEVYTGTWNYKGKNMQNQNQHRGFVPGYQQPVQQGYQQPMQPGIQPNMNYRTPSGLPPMPGMQPPPNTPMSRPMPDIRPFQTYSDVSVNGYRQGYQTVSDAVYQMAVNNQDPRAFGQNFDTRYPVPEYIEGPQPSIVLNDYYVQAHHGGVVGGVQQGFQQPVQQPMMHPNMMGRPMQPGMSQPMGYNPNMNVMFNPYPNHPVQQGGYLQPGNTFGQRGTSYQPGYQGGYYEEDNKKLLRELEDQRWSSNQEQKLRQRQQAAQQNTQQSYQPQEVQRPVQQQTQQPAQQVVQPEVYKPKPKITADQVSMRKKRRIIINDYKNEHVEGKEYMSRDTHPDNFIESKELPKVDKDIIEHVGGTCSRPIKQLNETWSQLVNEFSVYPATMTERPDGNEPSKVDINVYHEQIIDTSFTSAIEIGQFHNFEMRYDQSSTKPFRVFSIIAEPILTKVDIERHFYDMKASTTLIEVAERLKEVSLIEVDSKQEQRDIKKVATFINTSLTTKVNNFLRYQCRLKINIDDFAGDISEVRPYLVDNYDYIYGVAYDEFEQAVLSEINNDFEATVVEDIKDSVTNNTGANMYINNSHYTFTYLGVTEAEVGLNKIREEVFEVLVTNTPMLYHLCDSLGKHKAEKEFESTADIFITSDGGMFRAFCDRSNREDWYLQRINYR